MTFDDWMLTKDKSYVPTDDSMSLRLLRECWFSRDVEIAELNNPKTKTITLRKALMRDGDGENYYTLPEGTYAYQEDKFFVRWIGEPVEVEITE